MTSPTAPGLTPRLILREIPLAGIRLGAPPEHFLGVGTGIWVSNSLWGGWQPGSGATVLAAGSSDGRLVTYEFLSPTEIQPAIERFDVESDAGSTDASAIDWGSWGTLNGRPALVTGGRRSPVLLWTELPGSPVVLAELPIDGTLWGQWATLDGQSRFMTGDENGLISFWKPAEAWRTGSIEADEEGDPVTWACWGEVAGELTLATGSLNYVRTWPADVLRVSRRGYNYPSPKPTTLLTEATVLGAWGGGHPLATIDARGNVRFLGDAYGRTDYVMPIDGFQGRPVAMTWGRRDRTDGAAVLTVCTSSGDVWFLDPQQGTIQHVPLDRGIQWAAWEQLDSGPVLAAGSGGDVGLWDLSWERPVSMVPQYRSDSGRAVDLLGRRDDAAALADLITARSAQPPLAVGLFGQWGDGKSLFLDLLQEQVHERARIAGRDDPITHGRVRQVRFNAWHYAEADLWASLVAELFSQLAQSPDGDPEQEQRRRSRLTSELIEARGLREQLAAAEQRLADLRAAADSGAVKWSTLSPSAQLQLLTIIGPEAQQLYESVGSIADLGRLDWRTVRKIARELPTRYWVGAAAGIALAVALAIWGPGLVRWLATIPAVLAVTTVLAAARPIWSRIKAAGSTLSTAWQRVRRMRDEQSRRLDTARAVAAAEVEELRSELQNLTAAGQLAGLVQDRAGAGTYRQRLGLMTQIRQDFDRMAELLQPGPQDLGDLPERDAAGDELPAIDRIVIYIDDLDRCPPQRVVEVLEAIHLLLAVPLFVVVVAVDPRWLLRALTTHYQDLFTEPASADLGGDDLWASTPSQYLEKIFQIVLTLPPMKQAGYRRMIEDLVGHRAEPTDGTVSTEPSVADTESSTPTHDRRKRAVDREHEAAAVGPNARPEVTVDAPAPLAIDARIVDRIDPLALAPDEYALISLLGPPLVNGPRAVKRLANSYGLLAATSPDGSMDLTAVTDDDHGDAYPYRAGMVLLAAVIGFPMLGPGFFTDLHRIGQRSPALDWRIYLNDLRPEASSGNRIEESMSEARRHQWAAFIDALGVVTDRASAAGLPVPARLAFWAPWVVPVGRLSFPTGAAVTRLLED